MNLDFTQEYNRKSVEYKYIQMLAKDFEASKDENRSEPYIALDIRDRRNFIYNYGTDALLLYETILSFLKAELREGGSRSAVIPQKLIWLELDWNNRKYNNALKTLVDNGIVEAELTTKGVKFTLLKDYRRNGKSEEKVYLKDLYRACGRYIEKDKALAEEIRKQASLNSKLREANLDLREAESKEAAKLGLEQIHYDKEFQIKVVTLEDIQNQCAPLANILKKLNLSVPMTTELLNSTVYSIGNYIQSQIKDFDFSSKESEEIQNFLMARQKACIRYSFIVPKAS